MFTKKSKTAFLFFSFVFTFSFGQLKVLSNGNVGIGNSNPAVKLRVEGEIQQHAAGETYFKSGFGMSGIQLKDYPCRSGIRFRAASACNGHDWLNGFMFEIGLGQGHGSAIGQGQPRLLIDYTNTIVYNYLYAVGGSNLSDKSIKNKIFSINSATSIVLQLRGVNYDMNDSIEINNPNVKGLDTLAVNLKQKSKIKIPYGKLSQNQNTYGFIAQEVERVLPQLVTTTPDGLKALNYDGIIPFLVEAIKEQNAKIENMEARLRKLEKPKAGARTDDTKSSTEKTSSIAFLYQNTPNPFSQETTIKYSLPETVQDAFISITDLNGKQLKTLQITTKGESSVALKANELYAGLFVYTLVADGNIVDSKRMVIVE